MKFLCPFDGCVHETYIFDWYLKHVWEYHSFSAGFSVSCSISGCVNTYTSERSMRRHIKAKHPIFYQKYLKNQAPDVCGTNDVHTINNDGGNDPLEIAPDDDDGVNDD